MAVHPVSEFARISVAGMSGYCSVGKKCLRKDGHEGECWPSDKEEK